MKTTKSASEKNMDCSKSVARKKVWQNKSAAASLRHPKLYYHKSLTKMTTPTTNTAVIYARVSSTGDRQSTARQVADLTAYANANSLTILRVFEEKVSGAKKLEERPVLSECLDYCEAKKPSFLLLSELSRLGRSTLQVLRSLERLHAAGVSVYIQNIGLSTLRADGSVNPIAGILVTVLAEISAIEREQIVYRLNSGRKNYVARGGRLGRKKGSLKLDDAYRNEYADVIRLLRRGLSIRNVAKITGRSTSTVQKVKRMAF